MKSYTGRPPSSSAAPAQIPIRQGHFLACDLTYEYVGINADYSTQSNMRATFCVSATGTITILPRRASSVD